MDGAKEFWMGDINDLAMMLLLNEVGVYGKEPDLYDVMDDLIGARFDHGDEKSAKVKNQCVMAVIGAWQWISVASHEEIVARAEAVDVEEENLESLRVWRGTLAS